MKTKSAASHKPASPSRRRLILSGASAAIAAPFINIPNAWAAGKSLNVATYTSQQGAYVKDHVIPAFQAKYNCTVYQTMGVTLSNIALLRTQKSAPKFSVAFMDDIGVPIAKQESLITKLPVDQIPNLKNVFKRYIVGDGYGSAFSISTVAPWYSTTLAKPIDSWDQLWDKQYAGRFALISPTYSQSVFLTVMAAALAMGTTVEKAQYHLDQAWPKMKALKPNVQTLYTDPAPILMRIVQGQLDIAGPDYSKAIDPYTVGGAPVALSTPKEGAFAGVNCITLVNDAPEPELGAAFINTMLEVEVQTGLANATYAAPSVEGAKLDPKVLALVAYPDEKIEALHQLDWSYLNPRRNDLINTYNQIFGA